MQHGYSSLQWTLGIFEDMRNFNNTEVVDFELVNNGGVIEIHANVVTNEENNANDNNDLTNELAHVGGGIDGDDAPLGIGGDGQQDEVEIPADSLDHAVAEIIKLLVASGSDINAVDNVSTEPCFHFCILFLNQTILLLRMLTCYLMIS